MTANSSISDVKGCVRKTIFWTDSFNVHGALVRKFNDDAP